MTFQELWSTIDQMINKFIEFFYSYVEMFLLLFNFLLYIILLIF